MGSIKRDDGAQKNVLVIHEIKLEQRGSLQSILDLITYF